MSGGEERRKTTNRKRRCREFIAEAKVRGRKTTEKCKMTEFDTAAEAMDAIGKAEQKKGWKSIYLAEV